MSVSIQKTGVVNASGEIGANICPNTTSLVRTYTYPTSGTFQDRFRATTSIIPTASNYVMSFWAKSTVNGDVVRAHYYNPNTVTRSESSQGVVMTMSDGTMDITLSTTWEFYWIRYTQSETTAKKQMIFPRMFTAGGTYPSGSGTVSVKGLKFEEGTIPTEWTPCSDDTMFVGSKSGFNEEIGNASITSGYINATEFIEY